MPYTRTSRRRYAPRRASEQEIRAWAAERPENEQARAYLEAENLAGRLNSFTHDIHRKLHQYGNLSERQVAAVLRGAQRDAEWAARREAEAAALEGVAPLAEGRRRITGEIVSAKVKTTRFGWVAKMLVREPDGNKVWGSIPRAMLDPDLHDGQNYTGSDETLAPLVGTTVTIIAAVRRSDDDTHFGFFSRPQLLAGGPERTEILPPAYTPEPRPSEVRYPRCERGHIFHPGDGFCETCAEGDMEARASGALTGDDFGEDL